MEDSDVASNIQQHINEMKSLTVTVVQIEGK